ncbi:hypothetical protein GL50803_009157 [Giardia duodenalis]|uniref:Uncharacterized protein n=2 Tax=Giardia intestinalis TaxID=5741 RepID=A8B9W9_GIAIC|nr:hypothetical protein GL50803_009157 [Giardia intestinalis]ESU39044.1 hypothetical protein DHA2_150462 [Giardia intestinalis]KAE8306047.1 hypothetical protein GL50803_009157 [Giardia intestinalis]|eukprot:XP_001708584.1 Hypothetical protein GL50803_9157 [Giardia lamblia ATCC 50803]
MNSGADSVEARIRKIGQYVNVDRVVDLWNSVDRDKDRFQIQGVIIKSWSGRPKTLHNGLTYFTIGCEVDISGVILLIMAPIPYGYPSEQPRPYMTTKLWYNITSPFFDVRREKDRPTYRITYKRSFSAQSFLSNMRMLLSDLKDAPTLGYTSSYYALKDSIDNAEKIIKNPVQLKRLSRIDTIFKACNDRNQIAKQVHTPFNPETMLRSTIDSKGSSILECYAIKNALSTLFKAANTRDGPVFSEDDLVELLALYKELIGQYLRNYEVSA